MRRVDGIDALPGGIGFALAIGMFDGVHRGHQRVLRTLVRGAAAARARSVVLTFEPHPAVALRGTAPPLLCDTAERYARIGELGVDLLVVQRFDPAFAAQSAADFLARIGAGRSLRALVMTEESGFGRDRSAGLTEIRRIAAVSGFRVIEVSRVASEGASVSSTRLRTMLAAGRLAEVRRLLGRPYAVVGEVVRGDRRGHTLGYPTANLAFAQPVALPPDGIYAVRIGWGGGDPLEPEHRADGVASLGVRPTFGTGARTLEAHVFDFSGDLYGRRLRVEFVRRLRGERKFASVPALIRQMDLDAQRARRVLGEASG